MTSLLYEPTRQVLLTDLRVGSHLRHHTAAMLAIILIGGAIYGAALGAWHGPRLSLYVSLKVPLLLLGTATITAAFNWTFAAAAGIPLRIAQTFALTLLPLAIASVITASLAPVAFLFARSLPPPGADARTLHNVMYLIHTAIVAGAGIAGMSFLREALLEVCSRDNRLASRIQMVWIAVYGFTAGQIAWALRPFVGSVYLPVEFLRADALNGNVYEFILTDIVPHLWRRISGDPS